MKDIPLVSKDLIEELSKQYKPRVVGAVEMASERDRLILAEEQGKIDLVQQLARRLAQSGNTESKTE